MSACESVDRWLEAGGASFGPLPSGAREHASACARCGARLAAEREIEALLASPPAAPAGFAAGVMRRVVAVQANAGRTARALPPAPVELPLWVRVASDPAVALAALVAGALAWKAASLLALADTLSSRLGGSVTGAAPGVARAFAAFTRPDVGLGLLAALAVPLVWVSWLLYDGLRRLPLAPPIQPR